VIDKVNKMRNPRFDDGRQAPRGWNYRDAFASASWERPVDESGVVLRSDSGRVDAGWSQTVSCKADEYYRIEAVVSCDLKPSDDTGGFVLSIQPLAAGESAIGRRCMPAVHRCGDRTTVRATYHAPDSVRRVRISVGIESARGRVTIHEVRFVLVLEPDEEANILGLPVPAFRLKPPAKVRRVCVCSESASERPITRLLETYFGEKQVTALTPDQWSAASRATDAVLLPDATPPPAIRSLAALFKLAADCIVVMSLPAFARLSREALKVRRITQYDDPTFARVTYADFATQGFALMDTFAYSWPGKKEGSHGLQQYRTTKEQAAFMKRHGLVTLLESMCDKDATSKRPLALFKRTEGGALFVFDIEPIEEPGTSLDEPMLSMHVLLSMLGSLQTSLGQFAAPVEEESGFRMVMREMPVRFRQVHVHEEDVPVDEVDGQLITIGGEDESFGLPLTPKPVILVRSGLFSGDVASVYGALMWFKQFVRMEPHTCRYADALATQFRMSWVPAAASWEAPEGWRPKREPPDREWIIETEDADLAALIDVVSCPRQQARIIVPSMDGDYSRVADWAPELLRLFPPGAYFAPSPPEGASLADRASFAWRRLRPTVFVEADADRFSDETHGSVIAEGGRAFIIEVPDDGASFTAHSIQRTDLVATLLEHVIGLVYGLIAVNRTNKPVTLNGFQPLSPGEALVIDHGEGILHRDSAKAV